MICLLSTKSSNTHGLNLIFELHIPAAPIKEDVEFTVKVRLADEMFKVQSGYELVSAIYSVSTNHPLPVQAVLKIQHCVPTDTISNQIHCKNIRVILKLLWLSELHLFGVSHDCSAFAVLDHQFWKQNVAIRISM